MFQTDYTGEKFYIFAMELFSEAGHVFTTLPEFFNHSPEQFVFFDNNSDVALSSEQRSLFRSFNFVSRLFSVNDCAFFSINLLTAKKNRSQTAHDIHMMIHHIAGISGTICLFRYDDEVMVTFEGFGKRCILSDWYLIPNDYNCLIEKLDIANITITNRSDYFYDMVYILARDYYLFEQPTTYEILPLDFILSVGLDGINRAEIDEQIVYYLASPQCEYGDDYVEYDDESVFRKIEIINSELDIMLLDMDDDDDNPFDEDIESDDDDLEEDGFYEYGEESAEVEEAKDVYEYDDVDPEIFRDPTLLLKWLDKTGGD